MLPGFIPRLHEELLRILNRQTSPSRSAPTSGRGKPPRPATYDPYEPLRPLAPHIAILNNPTPPPSSSTRAAQSAGKAPAFAPACMAWVGGSLAGYVPPCLSSSVSYAEPMWRMLTTTISFAERSRLVASRSRGRNGTKRTYRTMKTTTWVCHRRRRVPHVASCQTGHGARCLLVHRPRRALPIPQCSRL